MKLAVQKAIVGLWLCGNACDAVYVKTVEFTPVENDEDHGILSK